MYVETIISRHGEKTYTCHLLRETYREGREVKHRTMANLSACSPKQIEAIRLALRHADDLTELCAVSEAVSLRQGQSVGAVWVVFDLARQLGIAKALGTSRQGKLALWQVIARVIDQGSRLSAVRLAGPHAACDVLGLDAFHEDHLYENLDWLARNQARIEVRLFRTLHADEVPRLYLYDVTSSYLEGTENELAAFGYNRDGKRGKRQIVLGLLCNQAGKPLSVEVFPGNTQDPQTFASQVRKAAGRFGGGEVTFVGDRGMIKSQQIEDVVEHGFHYITAITKPQIEALLREAVLQLGLFDEPLAEVTTDDGVRYILRRNPVRAAQVAASRQDKLQAVRELADNQTRYLAEHPRAHVAVAVRKVVERSEKLRASDWTSVSAQGREVRLTVDEAAQADAGRLDGCYVLKTDLVPQAVAKETVHDRYKDLTHVERAFRTSKTVHLEMRPIHVRLADRTRGHAFVVMLAYRIVQELASRWAHLDGTVQEGIEQLCTLCMTQVCINGQPRSSRIPQPSDSLQRLLDAARVRLPDALPHRGVVVASRKKLPSRRTRS